MKKSILTFSLLLALSLASIAQNSIPIIGKIVSESTKEPVPYAPEILKGFVTERAYPDSNRQDVPFYIVEAYKDPYSKASTNGDIKLLKGRRFTGNNIDSLPVRFYGGVHNPHNNRRHLINFYILLSILTFPPSS